MCEAKVLEERETCNLAMQKHHLNSKSGDVARNLRENQLGGVIFGCKHDTIEECFKKQLFGLPSVHYSYVRNIKPGLPLFLFNYSDRMLHGLFEAASPGQMSIDPYAWSKDGSLSTAFPAQVHICMKTQYPPLLETQFKKVLGDNYYNHHHFYFELDHAQTRALIALFKSLAPANVSQALSVSNRRSLVVSLPSTKRKGSVVPESEKVTTNKIDSNPFSILSISSVTVPHNRADSDAGSDSISKNSQSNTDGKESQDLDSDREDLYDNIIQNQSDPDLNGNVVKTVDKGMGLVECKHPVVNPMNGEKYTFDEDMLVNSCNEHKASQDVDDIESEAHNNRGDVRLQPERLTILKKLKELSRIRQQVAIPSQNYVVSSSDQCVPEETQGKAQPSCDPLGDTIEEEVLVEECHAKAEQVALPSQDYVVSSLDQCVPGETQDKAQPSCDPLGARIEEKVLLEECYAKTELLKIIADLTERTEALEKKQTRADQDVISLRAVAKESGRKVQQLEHVVNELQFKYDSSLSLLPSTCDNLDKPSIFLIGGYNGVTWLSSLDSFSPKIDILVGLTPMGSARSYASAAALDGHIFAFGGGDGTSWYNTVECYSSRNNEWTECPSLNREKGSLAGISLNDKIYAVGGGNGDETYSDVEMFDPYLGKWICSPSMLLSRFALAAAELNGVIYTAGGYDGCMYMESAERYDPREGFWVRLPNMNTRRGCHALTVLGDALYAMGGYNGDRMVSSVEIYDPRLNAWRMGDPMVTPRGYAAAVNLDDSLILIGGMESSVQIVDTVEVYSARSGWQALCYSSIGQRSFASAVVMETQGKRRF
ncbi:hypothetical protein ACP4OV_006877 [Aristida adscensionis]